MFFLRKFQQPKRFKRTFCVSLNRRIIDVSRVSTLKRCNGVETPFKKLSFSRELSGIILENSKHPDIYGPLVECGLCGGNGCSHCS